MEKLALGLLRKTHMDIFRTIATAKVEFFVALVISFQPPTNFKKNPNIGPMGVLNSWSYLHERIILYCKFVGGG